MEEEEEDCVDINAHEVISVADWKAQVGSKGRRSERESRHGTSVRCQVCPVGTRPNAYYCLKCSNELGKPFGVCGSKTGRSCVERHQCTAALK